MIVLKMSGLAIANGLPYTLKITTIVDRQSTETSWSSAQH